MENNWVPLTISFCLGFGSGFFIKNFLPKPGPKVKTVPPKMPLKKPLGRITSRHFNRIEAELNVSYTTDLNNELKECTITDISMSGLAFAAEENREKRN